MRVQQVLLMLSGLSFSGKSTLARELSEPLGFVVVNYDNDIYAKHRHEVPPGTSPALEFDIIESIARDYLRTRLQSGASIIYDDLGLEQDDRDQVRGVARASGAKFLLLYLDTPVDVIEHRRLANRTSKLRGDFDSDKFKLDLSLLERPGAAEDPITIAPEDSLESIVNRIRRRLLNVT